MIRMGREMLPYPCRQGKTQIRIDVDLAHGQRCRTAQLVFRDADGFVQPAAVGIDDFNVFRDDRRCTVEDDGEVGQAFRYFFENVEAQCRRHVNTVFGERTLFGPEFIRAVARADGDGQRIDTCPLDKFFNLFRTGIRRFVVGDLDIVFNTCKLAEFRLYNDAVRMCVFDDPFGQFTL